MILFFLTSGLFLGWSLGANDASNVFGSAVGSKMVSFRKAAIIASVFVIMGAVLQGNGAAHTLGKLGGVNALGGSFTLALAAAVSIYIMTKFSLPVSSTQAIVGTIIGWNLFTGNHTDGATLSKIFVAWISGPILGALFAVLLYMLIRNIKKLTNTHLIKFESYIRTLLIIVGAFASFSLGANNIANVMGVFAPAFNLQDLNLGLFTLSSNQQLFLLGGLAIAAGIMTYSRKVMETVGNNILELSAESALVVVLAESLVLFIFSSSGLSALSVKLGLPPIPLAPVSSSQVLVGCVIGIGIYKGARNINFRILGEIALGWLTTPLMSGVIAFFSLFFVKNVFNIEVGHKITEGVSSGMSGTINGDPSISSIIRVLLFCIVAAGILIGAYFWLIENRKRKELRLSEEKFWKNLK